MNTDVLMYSSIRSLWVQYCGTCNEYNILKQKWVTFSNEPYMPRIDKIDVDLTKLIEETDKLFLLSGFKKGKTDDYSEFKLPKDIFELESRFLAISQYLGLLKTIFSQRTVSLEIPFIVTSLPKSPEISIGNELQILVADILTKSYLNSIRNLPGFSWDGMVSFMYPSTQNQFFGGLFSHRKHLDFFHILISEEVKTFLGRYSLLAHEVSHSLLISKEDASTLPKWLRIVTHQCYDVWNGHKQEIVKNRPSCTEGCYTSKVIDHIDDENIFPNLIVECIVDLLAYRIGGLSTVRCLVDFFFNKPEIIIRLGFLLGYLKQKYEQENSEIQHEISILEFSFKKYGDRKKGKCNDDIHECYKILLKIGIYLGIRFSQIDQNIHIIKLMCNEYKINDDDLISHNSIIDALILNDFSQENVSNIQKNLESHILSNYDDPRKVLEAFYNNYRDGRETDYLGTIYSIVSSGE